MSVSGSSSASSWWRRPGECPPPPGFGWDRRAKLPSALPLFRLFRLFPLHSPGGCWVRAKRVVRGIWRCTEERVNDWENAGRSIFERPPPLQIPPSPHPPNPGRRPRLTLAPLGLPSQWRRKGTRPGWNRRVGFPRTFGSTKRTSAPVNYLPRRSLTEFMRSPLEGV